MKKYLIAFLTTLTSFSLYAQTYVASWDTTSKNYKKVDVNPSFHSDSIQNFETYIVTQVQPILKKGHSWGGLTAQIVVEKDGTVTNPWIISHQDHDVDSATVQALRNSPKWSPGLKNGVPVRTLVKFTLSYGQFASVPAQSSPYSPPHYVEIKVKNPNDLNDDQPQFPGGKKALQKFLNDNNRLKGKDTNSSGFVFIRFEVEKDGSLSDIQVLRSISPEFDTEALRLVKLFPKWQPAKQNGKPVSAAFAVAISFSTN